MDFASRPIREGAPRRRHRRRLLARLRDAAEDDRGLPPHRRQSARDRRGARPRPRRAPGRRHRRARDPARRGHPLVSPGDDGLRRHVPPLPRGARRLRFPARLERRERRHVGPARSRARRDRGRSGTDALGRRARLPRRRMAPAHGAGAGGYAFVPVSSRSTSAMFASTVSSNPVPAPVAGRELRLHRLERAPRPTCPRAARARPPAAGRSRSRETPRTSSARPGLPWPGTNVASG